MPPKVLNLDKLKTSNPWTSSSSETIHLLSSDSNLHKVPIRARSTNLNRFAPIMGDSKPYDPSSTNNVVSACLRELAEDRITVKMENLPMGDDLFNKMTRLILNARVLSDTDPQIAQVIAWNKLVAEFNKQNKVVVLATKVKPYLRVPMEHIKMVNDLIKWTANVNKHMNENSAIGTVGTGNKLGKLGALAGCLQMVGKLGKLDNSTDVGKAHAAQKFDFDVTYSKGTTGFNRTNCYLSEPQLFASYIQTALNTEPDLLKIDGTNLITFRQLMVGMSSKMTRHAYEDIYDKVKLLLHVKSIRDADPITIPPWMMTPNKLKTASVYNDENNLVHFITDIPYLDIQAMTKLRDVLNVVMKKPIGKDSYSVSSAVYGFLGGRGFLSHQMAEDTITKMAIDHDVRPKQFPIEIGKVKNEEWRAKYESLFSSGHPAPDIVKRIPANLIPIDDKWD